MIASFNFKLVARRRLPVERLAKTDRAVVRVNQEIADFIWINAGQLEENF